MAPARVDLAMILLYPPRFTFIFSFLFSFCSSACCKLFAWFSRKTENWKILQVPVGIRFANKTEWNKKKTEQNRTEHSIDDELIYVCLFSTYFTAPYSIVTYTFTSICTYYTFPLQFSISISFCNLPGCPLSSHHSLSLPNSIIAMIAISSSIETKGKLCFSLEILQVLSLRLILVLNEWNITIIYIPISTV